MKTTNYDNFTGPRIKHLELIQAVIHRLGNDAFLVKGWAITVAVVFLGFGASARDPLMALAGVFPTLLFWLLDASFLRSERLFRELYDRVREGDDKIPAFFMNATDPAFVLRPPKSEDRSLWRTTRRQALGIFYGAILIALVIASALLGATTRSQPLPATVPATAPATAPPTVPSPSRTPG